MNKNLARKIGAAILCLMAIVMIFSGFFQGDGKKIIGKWETEPGKKDARVYEFYDDNTGVDYRNLTDGETYDAESFNYRLNGATITIDYGLVSRVYTYEVSGNNLLMDNELYTKTGSFNKTGWIKYILAIAMLILAKYLYGTTCFSDSTKKSIFSIVGRIKTIFKRTCESEDVPIPIVDSGVEDTITPTGDEGTKRLKKTFPPKSGGMGSGTASSDEKAGNWLKSAGDL